MSNKTPMLGSGQVHGRAAPGKKAPMNASSVPPAHGARQHVRTPKTDPSRVGAAQVMVPAPNKYKC